MVYYSGTQVRDDPALRESFMELAIRVFGLDFHAWHRSGAWGEDYEPHLLAEGAREAALGFTPAVEGLPSGPIQGEDHLFVWKQGDNPFAGMRARFPSLSHA